MPSTVRGAPRPTGRARRASERATERVVWVSRRRQVQESPEEAASRITEKTGGNQGRHSAHCCFNGRNAVCPVVLLLVLSATPSVSALALASLLVRPACRSSLSRHLSIALWLSKGADLCPRAALPALSIVWAHPHRPWSCSVTRPRRSPEAHAAGRGGGHPVLVPPLRPLEHQLPAGVLQRHPKGALAESCRHIHDPAHDHRRGGQHDRLSSVDYGGAAHREPDLAPIVGDDRAAFQAVPQQGRSDQRGDVPEGYVGDTGVNERRRNVVYDPVLPSVAVRRRPSRGVCPGRRTGKSNRQHDQ
jgi:hypothetical protein